MKVSKIVRERMAKEGYLTVPEVAAKVGQSEGTVRSWLADERVTSLVVGGTHFVHVPSVAKLLGEDVARILGLENPK